MQNSDDVKAKGVQFRFDDAAILAVATKIAAQPSAELSTAEMVALAALRRAHPAAGQTNEELGQWLAEMNRGQLLGVVSNTKGVLHEMLLVQLENGDGDRVFAAQFAKTNHAGFDIIFSHQNSGNSWAAQLKATDSEAYVREWLNNHPDGQILVTSEIAARMGLESTGISNAELTADTNNLVNLLIDANQNDEIWDYLPGLSTLSVAMVIWKLRASVANGEITEQQFRWMATKASGRKAARVLGISTLLSIPGINILTGITLLAKVLESSGTLERFDRWASIKSEQMKRTHEFQMAVDGECAALEGAIELAKVHRKNDEICRADGILCQQIFEKRYADLRALRDAETNGVPPLEYENPDHCLPMPVGNEDVDRLIRKKVLREQQRRDVCLNEARAFLTDHQNEKFFNSSLENLVGSENAAIIQRAISRV